MSAILHKKTFEELTTDELYELLRVRSETFVVGQNCVYQDLDYDDKKAIHRNNKGMETLVTSIRGIKHESETVIEREQELIKEVNVALKFLDLVRKC